MTSSHRRRHLEVNVVVTMSTLDSVVVDVVVAMASSSRHPCLDVVVAASTSLQHLRHCLDVKEVIVTTNIVVVVRTT